MRPLWLALALVAAVCGYALLGSDSDADVRTWLRLREDVQRAGERIDTLRAENERLEAAVEALRHEPAARERAVREELGWVRPGEVLVRVPSRDGDPVP